ncbi:NAD(P)/FAD-dependent oxidoreductase [Phaeovulum vinaykumarii]|uniref:Sulfide:quinone oxidoreductase n=1 Tax=Phaeovulum vinaykumarii TaxID=407234 RepID=A0A1N7LUK8_9RHOB|nr:FAD/NAD(P)-binding oxidoreductase [Phaeovulum vinaykumarii]SIS77439.1 sulfide:quinone oxidoreductase [Phaeovulum vinaykumarii]SOC07438.1 sulfide:quinone oxidoreductase [Phaeovulum vinaykumarii]
MTERTSAPRLSRRALMGLGAGAAALGALPVAAPAQTPAPVKTAARIVILGGGAAGTAMANRLVQRLDGAEITVVDGRAQHWYQPGFTLIAAGLKPSGYSVSRTGEWLPSAARWVNEGAAAIDPDARRVTTTGGEVLEYDYLVLACGMVLDWDAVEGFEKSQVGANGIGAVYAGPEEAAATWKAMDNFTDKGGIGLFGRPATEMKCAGAPLKYTFITDDYLRRKEHRDTSQVIYTAHNDTLFSVPIVNEKVKLLFRERGVDTRWHHVLRGVDAGARQAHYDTPEGRKVLDFDFINVIPPMRAPQVIRDAGLSWADRWVDQGWAEVDPETLRHRRYANIFAVGDVAGVPKGKTAASVKWQVPVVEDHLVADINGRAGTAVYNGYTSCPMITRIGRAMLVEFDYENNLTPSFPGVISPLEELWISWLMKEIALKPTYNAMLRGLA